MGIETDEIVPYPRPGGDSRSVDSPEATGYFSERFGFPLGRLLQAPTTVATSNRMLTAI